MVECPCNISLLSRHGGAGTSEVIWSEITPDVWRPGGIGSLEICWYRMPLAAYCCWSHTDPSVGEEGWESSCRKEHGLLLAGKLCSSTLQTAFLTGTGFGLSKGGSNRDKSLADGSPK